MNQEAEILASWQLNAAAWSETIAGNGIESRALVTNDAIVKAILSCNPSSMLDLGCGEGWLLQAVAAAKPTTRFFGLDAIDALTRQAATNNPGASVATASYQDIINGYPLPLAGGFDLIVFNFSLFGNELVESLLTHLHTWLARGGNIIIQTLHPFNTANDHPYTSQWLPGSWKGFSENFRQPAPWYFRTLENWLATFGKTGYTLSNLREPLHPVTGRPASILFTLAPRAPIFP